MACADNAALDAVPADTRVGNGPRSWMLPDAEGSGRLHLQHGPIDLIIDASGAAKEVHLAYQQADTVFKTVLDTLARQLPLLRRTLDASSVGRLFQGDVAQRMFSAAAPYLQYKVTPMIAVAGAVADHVLTGMLAGRSLQRVLINNGGDIALHLSPGTHCRIGVCATPMSARHDDFITLSDRHGVGGVATSGWQGRSHSLGIADAVTVLAPQAAGADAAATLIANLTDLPLSDKITRAPACSLDPDSDLGDRRVTVAVGRLSDEQKATALDAGMTLARDLLADGLIIGAYFNVQGQTRVVGAVATKQGQTRAVGHDTDIGCEPLARTGT